MPASTNASYVGRLAPPGRPNTTSTPSAFRHSITASTARMRFASFRRLEGEKGRLRSGPWRVYLRELQFLAAARAQRVVELDDLAAARAGPHGLVGVIAVQQRRDEPDERHDRRDQEP